MSNIQKKVLDKIKLDKIKEICRKLEFPAELLPKPILEAAVALIEAGKIKEAKELIRYYVHVLRKVQEKLRVYEEEEYEIPAGATGFVLYPPIPPGFPE